YFIGVDGSLTHNSLHSVMKDFINVVPREILTFTKTGSTNSYWRYSWHDENKQFIDRTANESNEFQWKVPDNAYYLRVSYRKDDQVKLEKGTKATDWTPAPEDT